MQKIIQGMLNGIWRPGASSSPGEVTVGLDDMIVFHDYVRVSGWAFKPEARLREVWLKRDAAPWIAGQVNLPKPGVQLGEDLGFCLTLLDAQWKGRHNVLQLVFSDGTRHEIDCDAISNQKMAFAGMDIPADPAAGDILYPFKDDVALGEFQRTLQDPAFRSILELGARARSQVVRRGWFPQMDYTGVDILAGENVDVVGDAHALSALLPDKTFDAVFSMSTFEHLAMPWKVVLELNKVMNMGGIGYMHAPQTTGLHDLPWDFWRFSDMAWHGLFNAYTGFEIVTTSYTHPTYIVPFVYSRHWEGYEGAVGFAGSSVCFRKVADTQLSWDVPTGVVTRDVYPA